MKTLPTQVNVTIQISNAEETADVYEQDLVANNNGQIDKTNGDSFERSTNDDSGSTGDQLEMTQIDGERQSADSSLSIDGLVSESYKEEVIEQVKMTFVC